MPKLTEEQLDGILWKDISILKLSDKDYVLVLLCENYLQGERLLSILKNNAFELNVAIDNKTKEYYLEIEFDDSDLGIGNKTGKTGDDYPPLKWLGESKVNKITTGIKESKGKLQYNPLFHSLDRINTN